MPASATRPPRPLAVLFACGQNSVRSPIAAGLFAQMFGPSTYVSSAGVRKGELDPFAIAVMAELGLDISKHKPVTFEELDEWEGLNFDLIITLAPEAHHRALELTRTSGVDVEYWPTADPTVVEGSRSQRLDAYREIRDQLTEQDPPTLFQTEFRQRVTMRNSPAAPHGLVSRATALAADFRCCQMNRVDTSCRFSAVVERPVIR